MNPKPDIPEIHETSTIRGFSLRDVCWGYRDLFARKIRKLFEDGLIGDEREEVTRAFFDLLGNVGSQNNAFDHVFKELLESLNPRTRWLMDLPGIFSDITEVGRDLARAKSYYGVRFFKILGDGGFGDTPEEVRNLMTHLRRLREVDDDLAMAFLKAYRRLIDRLQSHEIPQFIRHGIDVYNRNKKTGLRFMELALKSSETTIRMLTRECRLEDVSRQLAMMLRSLVGYEVEVADLGGLDSDELIERRTSVVCLSRWLYLPQKIRNFDRPELNRSWYWLLGVVAAGMLSGDSFPRVHGRPEFSTCRDAVGLELWRVNLFRLLEYVRILEQIKTRWPGAAGLIDFGLKMESEHYTPVTCPDRLFYRAVTGPEPSDSPLARLCRKASEGVNFFQTISLLDDPATEQLLAAEPELLRIPLRQFAFLPDFEYPAEVAAAPNDQLVADLKDAASRQFNDRGNKDDGTENAVSEADENGDAPPTDTDGEKKKTVKARFVYDEWNHTENDYYQNYCLLRETRPAKAPGVFLSEELADRARQVRRFFERIRPEMIRREKYLSEGDAINPDLLVEFLVQKRTEPSPSVRFYEQHRINRRDLAVLLLMDVSGSTGGTVGTEKTIDLEKNAALIFGEGLALLGDRFSVCGFSGNGRENCEYYVYKDFDHPWDGETKKRIMGAFPSSATRIGVALRHSGYRLSKIDSKQRLILLITDGKPMDSGYDPNSRYAQYDVRMACEENGRLDIHTFCISTDENTRADMEIMFPKQRFIILSDLRQLPRILPMLYIKLTA